MDVQTDHRIEERGDHRMVLSHFSKGHAYVVADRQHRAGKWAINVVQANVAGKSKEIVVDTRAEAIDTMLNLALKVLREKDSEGQPITGYSCLIPWYQEYPDGTKVKLHDKP
jgi:hypothetical protein